MKFSSQGNHSTALTVAAKICCAVIAICLLGAAVWAEWNIYGVAFDAANGGRQLVDFTRWLGVKIPDFMRAVGFRGSTQALSMGMCILAVCGLLLAALSGKNVMDVPPFVPARRLQWRFPKSVRFLAFVVGAACMTYLMMRVLNGRARQKDVLLWMAAIISFGAAVSDRGSERPSPLISRGEWVWLWIFTVGFAVFYVWHAMWWLYSSLGDEWMFYSHAMEFVSKDTMDPFSPLGIDGIFPKFVSFYQAAVMHVFGENNFGWRVSSAIFAVICFIPFYYYMKYYFSKAAAVIGTAAMACSYYLIGGARVGKPHNNANFFLCLAFCLYAYFRRFPSKSRCYICGSLIGMGFYFFTPAKFSLPFIFVMYVADLVRERELRRWSYPLFFILGFLVVSAPIIFHPAFAAGVGYNFGFTSLKPMGKPAPTAASLVEYVARNTFYLLVAPLYYPWTASCAYRGIVDVLSASLLALGLCWSMVWALYRRQTAALMITFAAALVFIGGTTPYNFPKTSRALVLFPWWAAFAGIGAWRLLELGYSFSPRRRFWNVFCYAASAAILMLNLDQIYRVIPSSCDNIYPEMIFVREVRNRPGNCHVYYLEVNEAGGICYARHYGFDSRFQTVKNDDLFSGNLWKTLIKPAFIIVDSRNREYDRVREHIRKCLPGAVETKEVATQNRVEMQMFDFNGAIAPPPAVIHTSSPPPTWTHTPMPTRTPTGTPTPTATPTPTPTMTPTPSGIWRIFLKRK